MSLWDYVEKYLNWGLCVIPIPYGNKEPIIKWGKYQKEKPTREELKKWFRNNEESNIAIVCGEVSDNFYPLDFDSKEALSKFFPKRDALLALTPVVKTSRGYHVWLKSDKPLDLSKRAVEDLNLEVLGERHFIIAPPSLHPSGRRYEFLNPNVAGIATLKDYVSDLSSRISELLGKPFRLDMYRRSGGEKKIFDVGPPYRGPTPKCILGLYGVEEGMRNEAGMRIASFLLVTRKLEIKDAWKRFKKWSKKNKPPLDERELKAIFDSVNEKGYIYGCDDEIKRELCSDPLKCPLRKYEVPPEVEEEVARILESDQPLTLIKKHLDNLIAGEDYNKQLVFLLLLSGKSKDPQMKQMILLIGDPGVGKTTLMSIADLFVTKTVGRFTEHGLDYSNLEGFEVLRLQEIGHADEDKQGVATVKFLSPDDRGFIVEYTIRDPETGEFATKQKIIPPITFISSTTRLSVDPQFRRRTWIITPDDSEEQTLRIKKWIAELELQENEVKLGLRKWTDYDFSKMVLKEFVRRVEGVTVLIPFPNSLTDIFKTDVLRVRGDYKKLYVLVKLYCMLNHKALPTIPATNSNAVLATPRSVLDLLEIAEEPLTHMTSELEKRTARTLDWLEKIGITKAGGFIGDEERARLAQVSGRSDTTIRIYLNALQKAGLLWGSDKKPKTWKLLYDIKEIRRKMSALSVKMKFTDDLMVKMSKEAQEWLRTTSVKMRSGVYVSDVDWDRILERYPLPPGFTDHDLNKKQLPPEGTEKEHRQNEKLPMKSRFNLDDVRYLAYLNPAIGICARCGLEDATLTASAVLKNGSKRPVCEDCGREVQAWLRMRDET